MKTCRIDFKSPRRFSLGKISGVTLLEILVVVAIILVLAALLVPAMTAFRERASQATCLSHMKQLAAVVLQYSADNNNRILPAASGKNGHMNDEVWYMLLDESGLLPGDPANLENQGADFWGGKRNSIMACPSRNAPPYPYWIGGQHALHYSVNQHPGFFNRVDTSTGNWPTLARITHPSRTFLLAESTFVIAYPNGDNLAYPHSHKGTDLANGEGMNLIYFDGHAEKFKGKLPVLPGANYTQVPYDQILPDNSFPWF